MAFTENPETKIVPNLRFSDYCAAHGVNQSRLRIFDYDLGGCPALYRWATSHPEEQKDSKALSDGRRYHHFVLEPDSFDQFYSLRTKVIEDELFQKAKEDKACKAKGFSTKLKVYEEWKAKTVAMGLEIITQTEFDVLQDMRRSLMLNQEVFSELGSCKSDQLEVSAFAGFEFKRGPYVDRKMQLKSRFDIVPAGDALIDLKTARTAHPREFAQQAYRLGYDLQAAFYLDCANANGLRKKRFGFLAQDKFPPYLSCIHWVNGWLGHGRVRYTKILSDLADAITRDEWPGYCSGELEPPGYAEAEFEAVA
jgi:hypothetical protein